MRDEMGVLLMEDEDGSVAVQLFAKPESVLKAFEELKGNPGDKPQRATLLNLRWSADGVVVVDRQSRMLPVIELTENRPDGFVLGEGPVKFKKDGE